MFNDTGFDWTETGASRAPAAMGDGATSGLATGTKVATQVGWTTVECLAVGDKVLTFDNGLRQITGLRARPLWSGRGECPRRFWPLNVPQNTFGNAQAMILLAHQGVVVESDVAEAATGDPFALIRAEALDGVCDVRRIAPDGPVMTHILQFEEDEIVFTATGGLCLCPAGGDLLDRVFAASGGHDYRLLSPDTDARLLHDIRDEIEQAWIERTFNDLTLQTAGPRVA